MKEHPIPQDITNYRFHIIGNMTLKQFVEVGAGCVIAVILYSINLPGIIKWPFIVLSLGLGAGAAFVPIEERPLDHWIITFFKVMYKPTQYFWRREPVILTPFLYQPKHAVASVEPEVDLSPARRERIKEFMASIKEPTGEYGLDYSEQERISGILNTFKQIQVSHAQPKIQVEKPNLEVRVRKLGKAGGAAVAQLQYSPAFIAQEPAKAETVKTQAGPSRSTDQIAQIVSIPKVENVKVDAVAGSEEDAVIADQQAASLGQAYVESQAQEVIDPNQTINATFNASLPFPAPPTEPNKLVGMVLTPQNELIPGAIVEVKTDQGHVARAVKTNALGQFFITTPLDEGNYIISIEKEGMNFAPQHLVVAGEKLEPMEIHSQ